MKIAICQIDSVVADFAGNSERILDSVKNAAAKDMDLVVLPELALCGYPPMDLLDLDSFYLADVTAFRKLQKSLPRDIAVAIGHISHNDTGLGRPLTNVISVVFDGKVVFEQEKSLLPSYDVFDENRYFEPAKERKVWNYCNTNIGFAICEDVWREKVSVVHYTIDPPKELLDKGAEIIIVPSASPFQKGKQEVRRQLCEKLAKSSSVPVAYCNMAGADDSLVFDGHSFFMDSKGQIISSCGYGTDSIFIDTDNIKNINAQNIPSIVTSNPQQEIYDALIAGIQGYAKRCGFKRAHLGLSGGIDSALVAVLAADALGAENLSCVTMPSCFSSKGSVDDSVELAQNIGCRIETLPIGNMYDCACNSLAPFFKDCSFDVTEENLQARIRGLMMMAWSNKFNSMLLATGNKSELAVGYCTLYGDMCGALAPIGDLYKTEVFALSKYINTKKYIIPQAIIDKAPSAELHPDQKDQDSLPPYDILDKILYYYIEEDLSASEIAQKGYDPELCAKIIKMTSRSEFKRRQAATVIKLSQKAFGLGRRIPIARYPFESNLEF